MQNGVARSQALSLLQVPALLAAALVGLPVSLEAAEPEAQLAEIVESLGRHETLYDNIDVRWHESYRKLHYAEVHKADVPQADDVYGRWVRRDGLFYLNYEGTRLGPPTSNDLGRIHHSRAYDGEVTRFFDFRLTYVSGVEQGSVSDERAFQPHLIPLRWAKFAVPLSTYLKGRDAIVAHPWGSSANVPRKLAPTARYEGQATINGLRCHRIVVDHVRDRGTSEERISARREFYLAIDRNLLPVWTRSYNNFYAPDVPIEETVLEDLREIEPGVWFPFSATIAINDGIALREKGQAVVSWKRDLRVSKVSLDPPYERDFFQSLQLPDGTPIERDAD